MSNKDPFAIIMAAAPIGGYAISNNSIQLASEGPDATLRSRSDYTPRALRLNKVKAIRESSVMQTYRSPQGTHLKVLDYCVEECGGTFVASAAISIPVRQLLETLVDDIETSVTKFVEQLFADWHDGYIPWVGRTLLTNLDRDLIPANWMHSEATLTFNDQPHNSSIQLGWGNSIVTTRDWQTIWNSDVRKGIVGAQAIWFQLDSIERRSADLCISVSKTRQGLSWGKSQENLLDIIHDLSVSDLCRDDIDFRVQGSMRLVSLQLLDSWGYERLRDRIGMRIAELKGLAEGIGEIRRQKYQSIVEITLFMLGLLVILQTVLALIQTAFSGNVSHIPGSDQHWSLMDHIRETNTDIWIGSALVLTLLLALVAIWTRRDSGK